MFFNSVKEINRLLSKGMTNIYLKVTIKKNWRSQNLDFLSLGNLSRGQFLGSSNSGRFHWTLKLLAAFLKLEVSQSVYAFCWTKINFNKNETESEMENPAYSLGETNFMLQLI